MKHYQACLSLRTLVLDSMGKGDDWDNFDDLGIAFPSIEGLRAWSCAFYAYHAVKFKVDEFVHAVAVPNTMSSVGLTAPDHTTTFDVDATRSCGIFERAFIAAASNVGLKCGYHDSALSQVDVDMPQLSDNEAQLMSAEIADESLVEFTNGARGSPSV